MKPGNRRKACGANSHSARALADEAKIDFITPSLRKRRGRSSVAEKEKRHAQLFLLPNPSPRGIPTRCATRFPTRCWTRSLPKTPWPAWPARRRRRPALCWSWAKLRRARMCPIDEVARKRDRRHRLRPRQVRLRRPHLRGADRRARTEPRHRAGRGRGAGKPRGPESDELGAGDQGIMFGYATGRNARDDADAPSRWRTGLSRRLAAVRKDGTLPWLRPDGKSQVTVEFEDGRPVRDRFRAHRRAARPRCERRADPRGDHRKRDQAVHRSAAARREHPLSRQRDRPVRHRRPHGRFAV